MTKEDIEKAALDFAGRRYNSEESHYEMAKAQACCLGFINGANWCINSVWHKDIQNGKTKKPILVKFNNGLFDLFEDVRELKGLSDMVSIFAYIEGLLPNKEE